MAPRELAIILKAKAGRRWKLSFADMANLLHQPLACGSCSSCRSNWLTASDEHANDTLTTAVILGPAQPHSATTHPDPGVDMVTPLLLLKF